MILRTPKKLCVACGEECDVKKNITCLGVILDALSSICVCTLGKKVGLVELCLRNMANFFGTRGEFHGKNRMKYSELLPSRDRRRHRSSSLTTQNVLRVCTVHTRVLFFNFATYCGMGSFPAQPNIWLLFLRFT